jgi:predicted nucleic acid-binding protein
MFTYGEFVAKVPLKQKIDAKKFLKEFRILPITNVFQNKLIAYSSIYEVPKKQMIDFLIAATALQLGIKLITENDKDFKKYKTLNIISYKLDR